MRYEDMPTDGNGENGGDPDSYANGGDLRSGLGEIHNNRDEPEPVANLYQASRRVNVRQAPSTTAPIVRVLEAGDRVPVAAIESGWAQLADTPGTELVKAEFLEEES